MTGCAFDLVVSLWAGAPVPKQTDSEETPAGSVERGIQACFAGVALAFCIFMVHIIARLGRKPAKIQQEEAFVSEKV